MDGQRTLLDRIERATAERRAGLTSGDAGPLSVEARMGLKFGPGDRVIDVHTGQRGRVQSGSRAVGSAEEIFKVEFAGGLVTHRGAAELERDTSLAAPPQR